MPDPRLRIARGKAAFVDDIVGNRSFVNEPPTFPPRAAYCGRRICGSELVTMLLFFREHPIAIRPNDPTISDDTAPLTIDVHAHVFNASDLQVKRFFELVVSNQNDALAKAAKSLGGILQDLGWDIAPSAKEELEMLRGLRPALGQGRGSGLRIDYWKAWPTFDRTEIGKHIGGGPLQINYLCKSVELRILEQIVSRRPPNWSALCGTPPSCWRHKTNFNTLV